VNATVEQIARGYLAAGLSVIPVRADGTKAPAFAGWREYAERRATEAEARAWWGDGAAQQYGIGITGGSASGNLAVLDFERWDAYEKWLRALPKDTQNCTRPCPLARTGGGGAHLYARLPELVPGTVLARRMCGTEVKTLIEVRANGQQVVAPGSPAECHKTGKLYEWLRDGWTVAGITYTEVPLEVWLQWCFTAEEQNEVPREQRNEPRTVPPAARGRAECDVRPGDDFNSRGTWAETGLFDSWVWHRELEPERGFVRRPGKAKGEGLSGTVGMVTAKQGGWPLFYCFTSNGAPFEVNAAYSRFRVYTILKHDGDWKAAARALGEAGYGSAPKKGANGVTFAVPTSSLSQAESAPQQAAQAAGVKPPLPLVYYSDVTPALDSADFVEGLLIDGAMTVIYGESSCGKTFFSLDLALHVAAGRDWRGRQVARRGVLYLALEGSHGIRNRIAAFKLANAANAVELPFAVVPCALNLLSPQGDTLRVIEAAQLAAERLTIPVGLIVVDTLSRAIAGGNENASEDMGALVQHLDLIRQALPAHVAVVHHSGKDTARGARGHSLLRAATDTEIEVTRDTFSKKSTARVTKQRELETGDEFAFQLLPVQLGTDRRGKPVVSCVVRPTEQPTEDAKTTRQTAEEQQKVAKERAVLKADEAAVLLVIDAEAARGNPGASRTLIGELATCGYRRASAALDRLMDRGEVVQVEPFERINGNKSRTKVKEPFARAKIDAQEPE
jgi:hypothetical protein